jgi:predicted dehydrogenase
MIKVGLAGYGFMGHMHAQCHEATGDSKVIAVADVEAERRREAGEKLRCRTYMSLEEMLAAGEIDMVDICSPTYLHEEMVVAAAAAGKPILCEKPMSLTLEACDRMIESVDKTGVPFMVAQVIRFWPEYQVIREILQSGRWGRLEWLSARRLSPPPSWAWKGWLLDPAKSGGAVLDLHLHDLDAIAWLAGPPKSVQAVGVAGPQGGIDSVVSLGWDHPSGAKSAAEGSLCLSPGFPFSMALLVACEKATIRFDSGLSPSLVVYPFDGPSHIPDLPVPKVGAAAGTAGNISSLGGYYNEIKYFTTCLREGRRPDVVTPAESREAVRICLAVARSASTGQVVTM